MFKALLKVKGGPWKDIFDTQFGITDSEALKKTMDDISSIEEIISWAAVLFESYEVCNGNLEEVRIVFEDQNGGLQSQHPGHINISVVGGRVIFEGECVP